MGRDCGEEGLLSKDCQRSTRCITPSFFSDLVNNIYVLSAVKVVHRQFLSLSCNHALTKKFSALCLLPLTYLGLLHLLGSAWMERLQSLPALPITLGLHVSPERSLAGIDRTIYELSLSSTRHESP